MNNILITTDILQIVNSDQAWRYQVVPVEKNEGTLIFLSTELQNQALIEELEFLFSCSIELREESEENILFLLNKYYRKTEKKAGSELKTTSLDKSGDDFFHKIINEAKNLKSSDIHIEPFEKKARIRLRIDGVLVEKYILNKDDYPALVNKIKIQANLDIAEKRLPQDGRIFISNTNGDKLDIRVSILPTLYGEKIVMRLLGNDAVTIDLNKLGFNKTELDTYLEGVKRPTGMILISGPTGSGKTTTLYATLQLLNKIEKNIITIEDPIEYTLEGVNQVQLKESIGLDFPSAMRTFLRQDPDTIMVGEIRDKNTASMAVRASLTGHQVLSTIHTNWSWGIIPRLVDMGIQSYLLADTLSTVVAQRLVRKLCTHCKEEVLLDEKKLPSRYVIPDKIESVFTAKGCAECFQTGFNGRIAVYEVITMDRELSELIKAEEFDVIDTLRKKGFKSLSDNAFDLLKKGITSVDEIYPILASSL